MARKQVAELDLGQAERITQYLDDLSSVAVKPPTLGGGYKATP